jgi:cation diffusion facilitator family transporter
MSQPAAASVCSVHTLPAHQRHETRTRWVVVLTAVMMVAELIVGYLTHSLALSADGWHMATHVGALGLSAAAYWYARTHAGEQHFAFGTGKVYALAGYTSAALLLGVAVWMGVVGVQRLLVPELVDFKDALPVAIIGLIVNLVSVKLLAVGDSATGHAHDHGHDHGHDHSHGPAHTHGHDHNLRAAYLHVLADALTSVLAIVALVAGQWLGWRWLDAATALVGAVLIIVWSVGLIRESVRPLLDLDPDPKNRDAVRAALENVGQTRVADLHLWRLGHGRLVCVVSVEAREPSSLDEYQQAVMAAAPISHLTIEIRRAHA